MTVQFKSMSSSCASVEISQNPLQDATKECQAPLAQLEHQYKLQLPVGLQLLQLNRQV